MGLDIVAYSNLAYVGHLVRPSGESEDYTVADAFHERYIEAYSYKSFAKHALMGAGEVRQDPSIEQFLSVGYFERTDKTEAHDFQAGSYSGYNAWRADLAARFNPYRDGGAGPSPEGPFYELIWFADNEGTLLEMACANLHRNFVQYEAEYLAGLSPDTLEWWGEKYRDWTRAAELGMHGGLIDFH